MGRLLLEAFDRFEQRVIGGLKAGGFRDFSLGHGAALRNIDLDGTRVSEVARRGHMTKQGMSQLLRTLEGRGYVYFEPDPKDARARLAFLTERGEALIAAGQSIYQELEREWEAALGVRDYAVLKSSLRRLAERS